MTLCVVSRHESSILDSREDTGQNLDNEFDVEEESFQQTIENSLAAIEDIIRASTENVSRILNSDPQEPTGRVLGNAIASNLARRRQNIRGLRERSVIVFTSTPDISQSELRPEFESASRGHSFFGAGDFQFSTEADNSGPRILPPRPQFQIYRDPEETGARPRSRSIGSRPNQIPVIQTPDSVLSSSNKENEPPLFVYPNPSPHYYRLSFGSGDQVSNVSDAESLSQENMANDEDDYEAEKQRIFKEFFL